MFNLISTVFILVVIFFHFYFLILEMFLWTKPFGLKVFKQTKEQAESSKVLAANQGLYNGFLAAGLIWGLIYPQLEVAIQIKSFFLTCIVIAGIYGALTVNKRILFFQAIPALVPLLILFFFNS